jgi:SAM-dependent methyltransferase
MTIQTPIAPDYAAIKAKQNAAWSSGDYAVVGTTLQIVGETLAEAMNLRPGSRVLDVAAGNGNATMAFARRWHIVTSSDYVQSLLDKGAARAKAEGISVDFQIADAEALPFEENSFDGTVSTFGVMFAPDQAQAAAELMRVTRAGGMIGLANWTPSSFIGRLFKLLGGFVPPPAGLSSPALWGDEAWLNETFAEAASVDINLRQFDFRYRDAAHFITVFRSLYGPVHKAFLAIGEEEQKALAAGIEELLAEFNAETDGSIRVPSDYAEVIIVK